MLRSYRFSIFAVVGWLALASLASAQTPNEQGVPGKAPAIKTQPADSSDKNNQTSGEFSVPVRIIESQDEADHSKDREAKSDEHDAKDLDAQVRAANAAERQIWIAYTSIFFTFVGTALLVWNLSESRRATKAAQESASSSQSAVLAANEANNVAREIGQAQVRAYLTCTEAKYTISKTSIFCQLVIANKGQSPADRIALKPSLKVIGFNPPVSKDVRCDPISAGTSGEASFAEEFADLGPEVRKALLKDFTPFVIECKIGWYDVFDKNQIMTIWLHPPIYEAPFIDSLMIKLKNTFTVGFNEELKPENKIND